MIVVRDLSVSYGAVRAVAGASLEVAPASVVAIVGSNGAGKTSTLRAISGLVQPSGGEVEVEGVRVTKAPAFRIARLGLRQVPEGGGVFAQMTVDDNLLTGLTASSSTKADVDAAYERFPLLADRRKQVAGSLSGGERQMLALARALVSKPRYLLLDEPSLGLAPRIIAQVFSIIAELREEGLGILLVEQNARQALEIADRAYVLEVGSVVLEGTGPQLLDEASVVDRYLGTAPDRQEAGS